MEDGCFSKTFVSTDQISRRHIRKQKKNLKIFYDNLGYSTHHPLPNFTETLRVISE